MKKYYNNIEVEVVAVLPNDEVAIRFTTGAYYDEDKYYSEPIEQTIVVSSKQLTSSPIKKNDIILEREKMLKEFNEYKCTQISQMNIDIRTEKSNLIKEIAELKKRKEELIKYDDFFTVVEKLKNNKFKFAVEIKNMNIMTFENYLKEVKENAQTISDNYFKNVCVRLYDNCIISDSNSRRFKLFETEEEAIEFTKTHAKDLIEKNSLILNAVLMNRLDAIGFDCKGYQEKKEELIKRHNETVDSNIKSCLRQIDSYKQQLIN